VETPRQFFIANLSIRKTGPSSVLIIINLQRAYIKLLYYTFSVIYISCPRKMHNLWLTGYQATEFPYMKNTLYMKFRFQI
jgi:hypothetical protein